MEDVKETEVLCEDNRLRKFIDSNGYCWYTDLNTNYLGEDLRSSLKNLTSAFNKGD
jgi:hypothetical protein